MKPTTRKVVTRSPAHTVRLLHLPQLQAQPVEAESSLERDFVQIAALYSFIARIEHQPFKLVWDDASYTPDFLLTFLDESKLVVEVKPSSKVDKYQELFQKAEQKLRANGFLFFVATDTLINASDRPANALLIRRYAKTMYPPNVCQILVERVAKSPNGLTVAELCGNSADSICHLRYLISQRLLAPQADLSTQPNSIVSIPNSLRGQSHALQFSTWINT